MLINTPGITLIAVVSLALGIGANTAVFSALNALLWRPLPVINHNQLVSLYPNDQNGEFFSLSYPNYIDIRNRNEVFSDVMAYQITPLALSKGDVRERVWGTIATGNYFSVLGVHAFSGRTLLPEDDKAPGVSPVAVISYGLWERRFASDPNIIGKTINLNGHGFTVVGVAPKGFIGTEMSMGTNIWIPMMMQAQVIPGRDLLSRRGLGWLRSTGRLKQGISFEQGQAAMTVLARQLGESYPEENKSKGIALTKAGRLHPEFAGDVTNYAVVLMTVVALILLLACINLAGLLLVRSVARRKEVGIRIALGAGRGRIIQQLLTESVLLSLIGGFLGVMLGEWLTSVLSALKLPTSLPIEIDLSLDKRVLSFSILLSLITGIIFGLVPALQTSRPDLASVIKDQLVGVGQSLRKTRLRGALIIGQVALSVLLLVTAGLFVRSLQKAQKIDPGFDPHNVLLMTVDLGLSGYNQERGGQFYTQLVERLRNLPGVRSASSAQSVPLGLGSQDASINIEGYTPPKDTDSINIDYNIVGARYFETMGIPLLQGADFDNNDTGNSPAVLIINQTMAKRFWPGQDPIGRRVSFQGPQGPFLSIKGVVKDGKYKSLGEEAMPYIYLPLSQNYVSSMTIHVRTVADAGGMGAIVRNEAQALDSNLPVYDLKPLTDHMSISLLPARFGGAFLGVFGFVALLLALIGIYGITAFSVAQRTREIGIRMALGARARQVMRLVMGQTLLLTATGLIIGIVCAYALGNLIGNLLYGISPRDPLTFLGITLAFITAAIAACYIPARRAIKVDPAITLKTQ